VAASLQRGKQVVGSEENMVEVIDMFNNKQKEFMKEIGISVNFDHLTDDDYIAIEETVSEWLQKNGFDKGYNPTDDGLMCESILDEL
jgi:hypothetical protein